jgi:bifunctional non-homologous end joining protein LigD
MAALPVKNAIIDGEAVCVNDQGRPRCHGLPYRPARTCCFQAFDLLFLDGRDLRNVPLVKRKRLVREIIPLMHPGMLYATDATNAQPLITYGRF